MTGIRKRISIGFLSIVALLFFAGMISLFELNRVGDDAKEILQASERNMQLAREMLDAVQEQNVAMIHLVMYGDRSYDAVSRAGLSRLDSMLVVAQEEAYDRSFLDALSVAAIDLRVVTDDYLAGIADTTRHFGPEWYGREYEQRYVGAVSAIKNYMTSTQSSLAPRTEQLKRNAYRAVTPVLISLAVMIAIVLMLYYFITIYYVNPIVRMNQSLGQWIQFRVPFAVKSECKDEILELKEKIDDVIRMTKQTKI